MKKFLVFLLILIILGGAAFFAGWAQFPLKTGEYGVMRSKTHGTDPAVIQDGQFRWVWYKLIPRNVTITGYKLDTQRTSFTLNGKLPSADVYAAFAGMKDASGDIFTYDLTVNAAFSLKGEALPALVEEQNIGDQAALDSYQRLLASQCADFVRQSLLSGGYSGELENIALTGTSARMEAELGRRFPMVENLSLGIQTARFPDMAMYRSVKGLYEDYLAKQRAGMAAGLEKSAADRAAFQNKLDEFAKYGELLTKYPVLTQFFSELLGEN